ncbi:MAG TPA: HIT family protein [Candidatus Saccharimonadales bacterium]
MKDNCLVCNRINQIQKGTNSYFVAELASGYAVMGDFQFYHGYTIFLSKTHAIELHELSKKQRLQFLEDMAKVAEAVYGAFRPLKLNYELLGNLDSHMHWHIFPRYADDPNPKNPVSVIPPEVRNAENTRPSEAQLEEMKTKLAAALQRLEYIA